MVIFYPHQKILLLVSLIFVIILVFFFFYFQTKLSRIEKALTSLPPKEVSQESPEEKIQPPFLTQPAVKTYTIDIYQDRLFPAGMTVSPEDILEFKLKNNTKETVIFKANPALGIGEDIALPPKEEKSLTFTAPGKSGQYKFFITTSQADLEGLLMVR